MNIARAHELRDDELAIAIANTLTRHERLRAEFPEQAQRAWHEYLYLVCEQMTRGKRKVA